MRNGRWVDDKSLLNWVRLGCKRAAAIEDILLENQDRISGIRCSLSIWEGDTHRHGINTTVKTTEEFDAWLKLAKVEIETIRAKKNMAFPIIDFGVEDLRHPMPHDSNCNVLFRYNQSYLQEISAPDSSIWSQDIRKAHVFSYNEAIKIKKEQRHGWIAGAKLVSASAKEHPFDATLRVTCGSYGGKYVLRRTKGKLYFTGIQENAKHYATAAEAEKAKRRIEAAYSTRGISLEVEIDGRR